MLEYKYLSISLTRSPTTAMKSLSPAVCDQIISLLNSNKSGYDIHSLTGVSPSTISRLRQKHCSHLPKASGGRPSKLSATDICHMTWLLMSGKADTAVQVTRTLSNITNNTVSAQTVRRHLKAAGMKAVVKKKRPALKKSHRKARLEFAQKHRDWTVEDWKSIVWSDETKINRLGSDGRKWAWKQKGEALSDRLIQGTVKFRG